MIYRRYTGVKGSVTTDPSKVTNELNCKIMNELESQRVSIFEQIKKEDVIIITMVLYGDSGGKGTEDHFFFTTPQECGLILDPLSPPMRS